MTASEVAPRADDHSPPRSRARGSRVWFVVLLIGLVAVAPLLLWWGRDQWFFLDEWSFLVNRHLSDVPSLLQAHNGHWVTLPVIAYRVLFQAFGLRYLPYQMLAVLLHLVVVVMIWFTMRRLGVRPVIATITALPFVVYGPGRSDILFAFQIALTGSLVFGLAQLLLATADAPTRRNDLIGIGFGLLAIMSSAVGVPMVVGAALAVLIRRGWRAALLQAAPLAVVYGAWYLAYARDAKHDFSLGSDTISFTWRMGKAAFIGFGPSPFVGLALCVLAALGIARAAQAAFADRHSVLPAVVAGLITSSLGFAALTAFARSDVGGVESAASGRYVYIVAALSLPVIALGAELLARYWVVLGAVPLVVLAIGIPDNIDLLRQSSGFTNGSRALVTAAARSRLLDQLPSGTRLFAPPAAPELGPTAGFLRAAVADDAFPALHVSHALALSAETYVALHQRGRQDGPPCPVTRSAPRIRVTRGSRIVFSGQLVINAHDGSTTSSIPSRFDSRSGNAVDVLAGPLDLTVVGALGGPPSICRIRSAATPTRADRSPTPGIGLTATEHGRPGEDPGRIPGSSPSSYGSRS